MELVQRAFKGIWIPAEIWLAEDLMIMEKLFLVEINSLDNEKGCFATNKHFSEFFGVSKGRCSQIINSLKEKGYISVYIKRDGAEIKERVLKSNLKLVKIDSDTPLENDYTYLENDDTPLENDNPLFRKCEYPYLENDKENNTLFNNTFNNTNNKKEKERACMRSDKSINKINNNISKDKKTDFDNLINSYTGNDELKETIYEFIKMRTAIKKPMTTKALDILLNKLNNLATDDDTKVKVLEQSIEHCWQTVYALKEKEDGKDIRDSGQFGHRLTNEVERAKGYATPKETASKYDIKIKPVTITDTDYSKII